LVVRRKGPAFEQYPVLPSRDCHDAPLIWPAECDSVADFHAVIELRIREMDCVLFPVHPSVVRVRGFHAIASELRYPRIFLAVAFETDFRPSRHHVRASTRQRYYVFCTHNRRTSHWSERLPPFAVCLLSLLCGGGSRRSVPSFGLIRLPCAFVSQLQSQPACQPLPSWHSHCTRVIRPPQSGHCGCFLRCLMILSAA